MKGLARIFVLGIAAVSASASAQFHTLNDNGSTVRIVNSGTFAGLVDFWSIGGSGNQISEQSYHYRLAGDNFERRVGTLGPTVVNAMGPNAVELSWSGASFDMSIRYLLTGGTTNADLAEVVRIRNTTGNRIFVSLFEYDDFDLDGASGDTATKLNSSTIFQSDGGYSITVGATPIPSRMEVDGFPNILNELTDLNVDDLDTTLTTFGPGDATFAMQWDVAIDPGQTFLMSKNKILAVPEPASIAALGLGAAALLRRRRKTA